MKKFKAFISIFLIVLLLALCTSCRKEKASIYFPEKNEKSGGYFATMADGTISSTVAEMFKKSTAVVLATVIKDDEQWKSQPSGLENARSEVYIEQVWKGSISVGSNLTIHETGWRYEDYDISIAGEPILRKDMKVILFLGKGQDNVYGIQGSYQGKMFVDQNDIVYPFSYYTDESAPFNDMKQPIALSEFKQLLNI